MWRLIRDKAGKVGSILYEGSSMCGTHFDGMSCHRCMPIEALYMSIGICGPGMALFFAKRTCPALLGARFLQTHRTPRPTDRIPSCEGPFGIGLAMQFAALSQVQVGLQKNSFRARLQRMNFQTSILSRAKGDSSMS